MSDFGGELVRLMTERGVGVRQLARACYVNPGHISNIRNGKDRPSDKLAEVIDDYFQAGGQLKALAKLPADAPVAFPGDKIAAIELARRATASDVGDVTCEHIEQAVDDMAVAYHRTQPADLLPRVRTHVGYVASLLDRRATLAQRRRLLVSGGWLSLLIATVLADLHDEPSALACLQTAGQLAEETGHREITAWTLETRAWIDVTAGRYREAITLAQAAQGAAPRTSSAFIQATAQEGRAWARLGDTIRTHDALARVEALASPLPVPDQPEHHYRYDPAKADAYVVTTLAWAGDPAAVGLAREAAARFDSPADGHPRHRRATAARLDLALALAKGGQFDEAAGTALQAVTSGYLVPSNYWRAREIITAVGSSRNIPEARELNDAYQAEVTADGEPPAAC